MAFKLSRRQLLGLATGGAAGLLLAGCSNDDGALDAQPPNETATPESIDSGPALSGGLSEPQVLTSRDGVLEATLRLAADMVPDGSNTRWALTVNGTTPGPTLRVKPGDHLRLTVVNQTGHATNLHTHGLHVSPSGNADNPFLEIGPGGEFTYDIDIPMDHPGGLHWYHPHLHHHVAEQLFAGFFGAIVVEDLFDSAPQVATAHERLLIIHDARPGASESEVSSASMMEMMMGREGSVVFVNGQRSPELTAEAGTLERWRILNASTSRFYKLQLEGHDFQVVGGDGGRLSAVLEADSLSLVPGERIEVLVRPTTPGKYRLSTSAVPRGSLGMGRGAAVVSDAANILTMVVSGTKTAAANLPELPKLQNDLRQAAVDHARDISLSMQGMNFLIDGRPFSADRIDIRANLGTTEEWTVRNPSTMDHPFHIHVWPFQVVAQSNGVTPDGWKDVVNVPAGGWVRLRIRFADIPGKTVYHCHILDHEDMGMMAVIEVT